MARAVFVFAATSFLAANSEAAGFALDQRTVSPLWPAEDVKGWAIDHSPAARMLDSERAAAGTRIDREDPKQCAQAYLKQQVLADFASHERNRAAADALEVYYRIVGLNRQRQLLVEATAVLDRITEMTSEAERIGIGNEDPNDVRRRRIGIEEKIVQLDGGVAKLRIQLAQLTGRSIDAAEQAILIDPLLTEPTTPSTEEAIAIAMIQRDDLRALRTLGQRLNANTLPAVRDLLAAQNPGLGLVTEIASRLTLPCLRGPDRSTQDLHLRRQQCHQLAEARADQIAFEVRQGIVDLSTAHTRSELAGQRSHLAYQSIEQRAASIELNQATPGSELLVKLEMLTARGDQTQNQIDQAVAWVRLLQAQGIALEPR